MAEVYKWIASKILIPLLMALVTASMGKIAIEIDRLSVQMVGVRIELAKIGQKLEDHERRDNERGKTDR